MKEELGDEVFDKIEVLCDKGDAYLEREKYRSALQKYWKAFNLLPEPQTQYPAGTWLLTVIGDVNFIVKNYKEGVKNLSAAKKFPEGNGNPFIHFSICYGIIITPRTFIPKTMFYPKMVAIKYFCPISKSIFSLLCTVSLKRFKNHTITSLGR